MDREMARRGQLPHLLDDGSDGDFGLVHAFDPLPARKYKMIKFMEASQLLATDLFPCKNWISGQYAPISVAS